MASKGKAGGKRAKAAVSKRATLKGKTSRKSSRKRSATRYVMPFWLRKTIAVVLALVLCFLFYLFFIRPYAYRWRPCSTGKSYGVCVPCSYEVHGLDVSHYQGNVDWETLRKNNLLEEHPLRFVFLKATEGTDLKDETYKENLQKARQAGLRCGAYHFFSPYSDPAAQARFFIENAALQSGDLPPVLDVENRGKLDRKELSERVLRWMDIVERHYGVRPILYTSHKFRDRYLSDPRFEAYPYWIAHYYVEQVRYEGQWSFWQYSDLGLVPGVSGNVDLNVFNGTMETFNKMLIP